jgi:hypothetical protein
MKRVLAALLALLVVNSVGVAGAHEFPDRRVRIVVEPLAADVEVSVFQDLPQAPPTLTVRNGTSEELEILGEAGEPFLRISPAGVSANERSPTYFRSRDPFGTAPVPATASPVLPPAWTRLTEQSPEWRWFERRAEFHGPLPPEVARARTTVTLKTWQVDARLGGRAFPIRGSVIFRPITGHLEARIERLSRNITGLEVRVLQGRIPGIQIRNRTTKRLRIFDREGRVFAVVGPDGVDVNVNSSIYHETKGLPEMPPAEPEFRHTQEAPVLVWLERRAAWLSLDDPGPDAGEANERGELLLVRWTVQGDFDEQPLEIFGITWWVPLGVSTESEPLPLWPIVGAAAAGAAGIATGAAMTLRNRRRR